MLRRVFIALLILPSLHASRSRAQTPTGSVAGVVLLGDTGQPASGTPVYLEALTPPPKPFNPYQEFVMPTPEELRSEPVTTDAAGHFTLTGVTPGPYYVQAYREHYVNSHLYGYQGAPAIEPALAAKILHRVDVRPGQTADVTLSLMRGGTFAGRLLYADGTPAYSPRSDIKPFPGDQVGILRRDPSGHYNPGDSAVTEPDGTFRIDGIAPGTWIVAASNGHGALIHTAAGVFGGCTGGVSFYAAASGTTMLRSAAREFTVEDHTTIRNVDLLLPAAGLHALSGRVEFGKADPPKQILIALTPTGQPDEACRQPLADDQTFRFDNLPDASYTLSIEFGPDVDERISPEQKTIRMRWIHPAYAPLSQTVSIHGADSAHVLLRPEPAR